MWSQSEALIQPESAGEERKGHKMNSARGSFSRQILEYEPSMVSGRNQQRRMVCQSVFDAVCGVEMWARLKGR